MACAAFYPAYRMNASGSRMEATRYMTDTSSNPSILRVSDLAQNRATPFALRPDVKDLTAITAELDLIALRKLTFVGQLNAVGERDWTLTAKLGATVIQPCVATLTPVTTRIDVAITRRYIADMPTYSEEEEVEMPDDDNAERLPAMIDIHETMVEALALHLPLYPRAESEEMAETVFTEPGKKPMTDKDARPFAGLAALRDQLSSEDDT
jgi:uncharacterized metal-binding protein YceD (DUF177 family)